MKYAITGGIGCGKSFVVNMLRERGVEVYDCDKAAKRLMSESQELKERLKAVVGNNLYTDEGLPRKGVMRDFILASDENRAAIDGIVHPAVAEDFVQSGLAVMECAILFESGFDRLVDKVVCVCSPQELRIQRVMRRDSISRDMVLEWISKQLPQEELLKRSDHIIYNDKEHNLNEQINKLITILK